MYISLYNKSINGRSYLVILCLKVTQAEMCCFSIDLEGDKIVAMNITPTQFYSL